MYKWLQITIITIVIIAVNQTYIQAKENVIKKEDVKVTIKAKEEEFFELTTSPVIRVEKVVVKKEPIKIRTGFERPVEVIDIRGEHDGWELLVSAEPFKNGESELPKGTLGLEPLKEIRSVGGNALLPSIEMENITVVDDGAVRVASAKEGEGMGRFELDFGENPVIITLGGGDIEGGTYGTIIEWGLETKGGDRKIVKQETIEIEIDTGEGNIEEGGKEEGNKGDGGKGSGTDKTNDREGKGGGEYVGKNEGEGGRETTEEGKNEDKEEGNGQGGEHQIPKTATNLYNYLIIGIVLLMIGVVVRYRGILIRK